MVPNSSTRGRLLVATPPLDDPNFDRTVVYMLEDHDQGAVGVVINRPSDAPSDELSLDGPAAGATSLAGWLECVTAPATLFVGGPVGDDSLLAVARGHGRRDGCWGTVTGDIGTVDLSQEPNDVADRIDCVRFFQGYSGWSAGQLDAEIAAGAWMVFDADPDDVFHQTPWTLWRDVLRRQGGRLRWIADAPDDLSAN